MAIGIKVSHLAKLKGISQGEMAEHCGISRISINRFYRGHSELKSEDLVKVLRTLGMDVEKWMDLNLEDQLEKSMQSVAHSADASESPVLEVGHILQNLSARVRKTLLEQISWWGDLESRSQGLRSTQKSLQRLQAYLSSSTP